MRHWYGAEGLAVIRDLLDGITSDFLRSPAVLEYPLFEEAIAGAYAVVTHSRFAVERVQSRFPGIVRQLALPRLSAPDFRIAPRNELPQLDGRLLAITVGDVNPNKRVNSVLEALRADSALAASISYIVIGTLPPEYGRELVRLVKEYELEKTVRFTGYMPDELLAAYLTHADFCIALRHPTTEAASASVIEQLAYGKPAIVSTTGFYSELPDDCVLKVRIDHEQEDLRNAMHHLAEDASLRRDMGRRARTYSHEIFRADRYAQGILQLAAELLDAKPLLGFTDRVGGELGRMGVASGDPIIQTVAKIANGLYGG
jgi:glycosyltransferase involved in cell wall biosynthesis